MLLWVVLFRYFSAGYGSSSLQIYKTHWLDALQVLILELQISLLSKFFFFTTNGYSITQNWSGLGNQTEIEQPMKQSSLWKDLTVLAKESAKLIMCSWNMDDLEIWEAYLENLYPFQLSWKTWPSMRLLNHGDQILVVRSKALTCRMLKHPLHHLSQRF